MPFCNEHNEVYTAEECPKCNQEADDRDRNDNIDTSTENVSQDLTDSIDDIVDAAVDSATDDLKVDEVDGDVVVGSQEKSVTERDITNINDDTEIHNKNNKNIDIDQSTTEIDQSSEVHDESTTVEDAVVKDSNIGGGNSGKGNNENEEPDSRSQPQSKEMSKVDKKKEQDHISKDSSQEPPNISSEKELESEQQRNSGSDKAEINYCMACGSKIPGHATECDSCGETID